MRKPIRCEPIAQDVSIKQAKHLFALARRAEHSYVRKLTSLARSIGRMVNDLWTDEPDAPHVIRLALQQYAKVIEPWAEAVARRMVWDVASRDKNAWKRLSRDIGKNLKIEIEGAPIGYRMQELVRMQVALITSLPLDAAQRVQDLAIQATHEGTRPKELAKLIYQTGHVTKSRATLIARTEVGRASTTLTQARAEYVGSTHFVWRTMKDSNVRKTHRALEGETFRWDSPPECDPGKHSLPGAIFNCRCYPEPVIPLD